MGTTGDESVVGDCAALKLLGSALDCSALFDRRARSFLNFSSLLFSLFGKLF